MKKSKSKSSEPQDRFSGLPDSLIFHIFWFLPMIDVVRTTILSKRWKNLWTTTPYLHFDDYTISGRTDSVRDFINRVLILWRGTKILKFKIDFRSLPDRDICGDYDVWVRFAMENKVEELYIHLLYRREEETKSGYLSYLEAYWVRGCIYRCSLLKVLSLKGCNFEVESNGYDIDVWWNHLKSLTIHGFIFEECLNRVLSGSPQLEVLILSLMDVGEDMSIRSSSLKKLCIDLHLAYNDHHLTTDTELTICTPNLETLEILGVPYRKCMLMNVSSLTRVTLGFNGYDSFTGNSFLGETLMQILPTIKYVENVTLSDWSIKVGFLDLQCLPMAYIIMID